MVDCLYRSILYYPYYTSNDIYITGFGRMACGYELRDDSARFLAFRLHFKDLNPSLIALHQMESWMKV